MHRIHWAHKLEVVGYLVYVILFGFFGLSLMYSDSGPGETEVMRVAQIVAFYFLFALPIGYFFHRHWWSAAGVAWAAVLLGLVAVLGSLGRPVGELLMASLVFAFPLALALAGGRTGAWIWFRRHPRRGPSGEPEEMGYEDVEDGMEHEEE
jgi:hypothetical protein